MTFLRATSVNLIFVLSSCLLFTGCQMGYLIKSGYNQMGLLYDRVPIDKALNDPNIDEEKKKKLRLSQEAIQFAENDLHLNSNGNYSGYVHLNRPYVTYVVSAAPKWKLEHHLWSFPFVGKLPYKGFFSEDDAKEEEQKMREKDFDTYMRGVSAYSTLGWFKDPLLSSMLRYKDHDLVNTIIHETVHATLYIKSSADFNERLAVFLGNKGAELFYAKKEGKDSQTLKVIELENADDKLFSKFISEELKALQSWYLNLPAEQQVEELRQERIAQIKQNFIQDVLPKMKSGSYQNFLAANLNNARLLVYKTYMQDLTDFENLFKLTNSSYQDFMKCCEKLKSVTKPEAGLKEIIKQLQASQKSECSEVKLNDI